MADKSLGLVTGESAACVSLRVTGRIWGEKKGQIKKNIVQIFKIKITGFGALQGLHNPRSNK